MSFFDGVMDDVHAACDEFFAHAAVLNPGAHACRAEIYLPEPEFGDGGAKTVAPDILLRVVKATLARAPVVGDVFTVEGRGDYKVLTKPTTEDDDGLRWAIKVETVA